jgi:CheY-like chemotaxis protein
VGKGTTFKILLPIVESAVEEEALTIQLPLLGGTETILVAEDEEALRNLARDILEGLDYTVLLAKNGEEAVNIHKANRERIDMLLLDVVMPGMGGIEAYKRIREQDGDVPLIFMTGYCAATVQNQFVKPNEFMEELGAMVLQKPYNVEGLGRKVREVLDKSEHLAVNMVKASLN